MLFLFAIVGSVRTAVYAAGRTKGRYFREELKLLLVATTISVAGFFLLMSYDLISDRILYSLGSVEHSEGDMAVGQGISAILAMTLLYLSGLHSYSVWSVARKKSLHELKRLKLTFCSGLSWFPWTLALYPQATVSEDAWIWGILTAIQSSRISVRGFCPQHCFSLRRGSPVQPGSRCPHPNASRPWSPIPAQRRCAGKFYAERGVGGGD